jgi:hypothetical protein
MNNRVVSLVFLIIGVFIFYHYRYKLLNPLLKNRSVQKALVVLTMNIPFVRRAFYTQVFQ